MNKEYLMAASQWPSMEAAAVHPELNGAAAYRYARSPDRLHAAPPPDVFQQQ